MTKDKTKGKSLNKAEAKLSQKVSNLSAKLGKMKVGGKRRGGSGMGKKKKGRSARSPRAVLDPYTSLYLKPTTGTPMKYPDGAGFPTAPISSRTAFFLNSSDGGNAAFYVVPGRMKSIAYRATAFMTPLSAQTAGIQTGETYVNTSATNGAPLLVQDDPVFNELTTTGCKYRCNGVWIRVTYSGPPLEASGMVTVKQYFPSTFTASGVEFGGSDTVTLGDSTAGTFGYNAAGHAAGFSDLATRNYTAAARDGCFITPAPLDERVHLFRSLGDISYDNMGYPMIFVFFQGLPVSYSRLLYVEIISHYECNMEARSLAARFSTDAAADNVPVRDAIENIQYGCVRASSDTMPNDPELSFEGLADRAYGAAARTINSPGGQRVLRGMQRFAEDRTESIFAAGAEALLGQGAAALGFAAGAATNRALNGRHLGGRIGN